MTTLKLEIAARESYNFMKAQSSTEERAKRHIKTEALMIGTKFLVCASCSKDHYHDKCSVVTNFEERKEIARKNRLCYKCLIRGHHLRNCRNKRNCFHCKASNPHTAICNKYGRKEKSEDNVEFTNQVSNLSSSHTAVLLQTAYGIASDNLERRSVPNKSSVR